MFFHLLAPVYTRKVADAQARKRDVNDWYTDRWAAFCSSHQSNTVLHLGCPDDSHTREALLETGAAGEIGPAKDPEYPPDALMQKGEWVYDNFKSVHKNRHQQKYLSPSAVVHVDGSGKIRYDSAMRVAKRILDGDNLVLGYRADPTQTMTPERVLVESFENFLVSETFHVDLPDAQCGCWALNARVLDRLHVTAMSYDIEIDLLIAALKAGVEPRFMPIELDTQKARGKPTDYKPHNDIEKLHSILNRLNLRHAYLPALIRMFEHRTKTALPPKYKKQALELKDRHIQHTRLQPLTYEYPTARELAQLVRRPRRQQK